MVRGSRKLKQVTINTSPVQPSLFVEETPAEVSLYEKRNALLIARYHHYLTQKMIYDKILLALENEFFISTGRIADIIGEHETEVAKMRKDPPKKEWYKIQWSHIVW